MGIQSCLMMAARWGIAACPWHRCGEPPLWSVGVALYIRLAAPGAMRDLALAWGLWQTDRWPASTPDELKAFWRKRENGASLSGRCAHSHMHRENTAVTGKRFTWTGALCAIALLLYLACGTFSEYWLGTLKSAQLGQDFYIYCEAYHNAQSGGNPYLPYKIGRSFVYHPFSLTIMGPFAQASRSSVVPYAIWVLLSVAAWIASALVTLALLAKASGEFDRSRKSGLRIAPSVALLLGFAPFLETVHVGQVNPLVVLFLSLTIYLCEQEREIASGLFLSLAILLKTSPLIFLAYFLILRRFRAIASTLAGLILFSVTAAVQFSPQALFDFASVFPRLASEIHPSPYNQSILGISSQLLRRVDLAEFEGLLGIGHRVAFFSATALLLATGLVIPRGPRGLHLRVYLFFCLGALMVFFSPLVWYHHSVLLLLPLLGLILTGSRLSRLLGLAVIGLIQVDRVFEHTVVFLALPVLVAHIALLAAVIWAYLRTGTPVPLAEIGSKAMGSFEEGINAQRGIQTCDRPGLRSACFTSVHAHRSRDLDA